jgi:hypothetical protein
MHIVYRIIIQSIEFAFIEHRFEEPGPYINQVRIRAWGSLPRARLTSFTNLLVLVLVSRSNTADTSNTHALLTAQSIDLQCRYYYSKAGWGIPAT